MSAKTAQIKTARYRQVVFLWLGIYVLIHAANAIACSCILLTLHEQFQSAEHVFIGRITDVREIKARASHPQWRGMLGAFQIQRAFKGQPKTLEHIETGLGPSDCGVSLTVGRTYLFFADKMGSIDTCSGSRAFDPEDPKNADVLKQLNGYAQPLK